MNVAGLAALGKGGSSAGKVALIFGREADGLHSSEVLSCTHVCEIATSSVQGSMSLPAAAALALGRTFEEALAMSEGARPLGGDETSPRAALLSGPDGQRPDGAERARPATIDDLEHVMARWERIARFADGPPDLWVDSEHEEGPTRWVRTSRGTRAATRHGRATSLLRRMLQRAQPTARELRALHGALAGLESGLERGRAD